MPTARRCPIGRPRWPRPSATREVVGAAPFIASQALLARGDTLRGALVRGIVPDEEARITELAAKLRDTALANLQPGSWRIVLGAELARQLGVRRGDSVTLVAPSGQITPAGVLPRLKQFTVIGTFEAGHYEYDSSLAWIHLEDAQKIYRLEGPSGVQLKLADLHSARRVAQELAVDLGPSVVVRDWTRTNRNWFDAVQIEKRLMAIILTLIVAVAAFNLVSTLVMTVTDKRADIAILRTLGASPRSVMGIFVVQGAAAGVLGTLARRGARPAGGLQHRRHRAVHRTHARRRVPARQHLPDQPHAERSALGRRVADRGGVAGARVPGHAVSELACQPRQPGRGAAL